MHLHKPNLITSVVIIDAKKMEEAEIKARIKSISQKQKEGELCLFTTLQIETSIETHPEGQVLNITIDDISKNGHDIESLFKSLSGLRDYYPDLTVKVIDKTDKMPTKGLPEDAIIKKNQE